MMVSLKNVQVCTLRQLQDNFVKRFAQEEQLTTISQGYMDENTGIVPLSQDHDWRPC